MKKKMMKGLLAFALMALFAAPAFAGDATNGSWTDPSTSTYDDDDNAITDEGGGGIKFANLKFSTGVYYVYNDDGGTGDYFSIGTYNSKSTKVYGTESKASKLYILKADQSAGTALGDLPTDVFEDPSSTSEFATTSWSEVGK